MAQFLVNFWLKNFAESTQRSYISTVIDRVLSVTQHDRQ
jgi:hypothetical protein